MTEQWKKTAEIITYVKTRKNKSRDRTERELLEKFGVPVMMKRVTWTGGVGSYKLMRSKKIRIQVGANLCGYDRKGGKLRSIGAGYVILPRKRYYKYAPCVEV